MSAWLTNANMGCNVALSGRTADTLAVTAQELRDLGVKTIEVQGDLAETGAPERLVGEAKAAFGRVDILNGYARFCAVGVRWGR